jgi:hypothetical protein
VGKTALVIGGSAGASAGIVHWLEERKARWSARPSAARGQPVQAFKR